MELKFAGRGGQCNKYDVSTSLQRLPEACFRTITWQTSHSPTLAHRMLRRSSEAKLDNNKRLILYTAVNKILRIGKVDLQISTINAVSAATLQDVPIRDFLTVISICKTAIMSPHRVDLLPSPAALPSYGISQNGFLPAEPPLHRLPQEYYQPWELVIEQLPQSIEEQSIRQRIDELPVLDTHYLESESEWQRAYSMLAIMAQGYIWTGPEPSEVGRIKPFIS